MIFEPINSSLMAIACEHKVNHGPQFCISDCPVNAPCYIFQYNRIERIEDLPAREEHIIDIAVLDMNHGWPNLGHDSLVHLVQDASCDLRGALEEAGIVLRVLSFDVRNSGCVPENPNGRFALYVGTGGPGQINPHYNNGQTDNSQGIQEDPAWERPFFELLDHIYENSDAALLAVCHTFGVMCRWSKIAEAVARPAKKGGKSSGILENILTPEAKRHPWFARFAARLPDGGRLRIMDNRLFDLIPNGRFQNGILPVGYETMGIGKPAGDALTMVEWARDREGIMPRIFGVNHHPEIVDRKRQLLILQRKHFSGQITRKWYDERLEVLTRTYPDEDSDTQLALTSDYTIVAPLRFHLFREVRRRAEALGKPVPVHEDQVFQVHEEALSSR